MIAGVAGGLVVTPDGVRALDVLIRRGRIAALAPPGGAVEGVLEANGCYVLPGGVDPHTHLFADAASACRSAAFGGTTTAISFTLPRADESPAEAVRRARDELIADAAVDVALHAYVSAPDRLTAAEIGEVAELGVTGIKLFTAYRELGLEASDGTVYRTMRSASRLGLPTLVHCENGSVIEALVEELLAEGKREARYFAVSRPPDVEVEAVGRVLAIARLADARVYLVHLSTAGALAHVRDARRAGVQAYAEACTHHLALDASGYDGGEAIRYLAVPPLRPAGDVRAVWDAVRDGTLDTIGSDHAQGRYQPRPAEDFTGLPYGLPGIEARLPLTLSFGLARGIPLERLVHLLSTGPARIFGLHPTKGAIAEGADADLVVWDPRAEWTIEARELHDGLGESPYAGLRVRGRVRHVVLRGNVVVADGELADASAGGRYVARAGVTAPDEGGAVRRRRAAPRRA